MSNDKNPLWPHMVDAHQLDQLGQSKDQQDKLCEAQIKAELEGEIVLVENIEMALDLDGTSHCDFFFSDGSAKELAFPNLSSRPMTKRQLGELLKEMGEKLCR